MLNGVSIFRAFLKPWTRRVARCVIAGRHRSLDQTSGRFTLAEVDRLNSEAWRTFSELAMHLPDQSIVRSRLNIRLACLTLAFFRALMHHGVDRAYAIELTDLTWSVYGKWGAIRSLMSRGNPRRRLKDLALSDVVPFSFDSPDRFTTSEAQLENHQAFRWNTEDTPQQVSAD